MSKSNVVDKRSEQRLSAFFTTLLEELNAFTNPSFGVVRQVQRARKRARFLREDLREKAVQKFLDINAAVGEIQKMNPPSRALDRRVVANAQYFITNVLERYTTSLDEMAIQQPLEVSFLYSNWRFGPGSSNGVKGTHTADKIWQDMTCTALCEPLVRKLRMSNPYFTARDGHKGVSGTREISGSRLTTVPKNEDTERTIAVEPSGNMALQLAAGLYLEGALRHIGLDIRCQQPKNKAMAQRGSRTGGIATLDLASASDMISIDLVQALMPSEWTDLLMKLRSPIIKVCGDEKSVDVGMQEDQLVELNMISTMGNGFTFPLMTLLLVALIYGFRCTRGGPNLFIDWTDTCVFGDDIIIPTHEYAGFVDVLTKAGLVVNNDKSFWEGSFRESCGGDYNAGVDVTPFYVKSLTSELDVYVVINQVMEWSARENLFLHRTLSLLRSFIDGKPHLVPEWMNPDQGVRTAGCPRRYTYLTRSTEMVRLPLEATHFSVPLICGGYVAAVGYEPFYLPRSTNKPRVKVRRSRLPKGYLDGWDPGYRSQQTTSHVSAMSAIHFGA